jgi:uncharacterized glyoxalase superfamily protein PhnB
MDTSPSVASFLLLDEDQLRHEVESLRASLSAETERGVQMGGEIARLNALLCEANATSSDLLTQRNMFKQQLEDQLKFKRGPLEAQLVDANRALFEQRLQFRSLVDAVAVQRDWVREWALQAQENQRLQDALAHREAGTEVTELRRALLEAQAKYAEQTLGLQQRNAASAVQDSKARSLALEVDRLTANNKLLQEQVKRLWRRLADKGEGSSTAAAKAERPAKRPTTTASVALAARIVSD